MLNNPLIQRYRYSLLRPKQFWLYQFMYVCIFGLVALNNALIFINSPKNGSEIFKALYYQVLTVQIIILWFWGSYNSGSAIRSELNRNTYAFFKMMPLPASKKAIGIIVGTNLVTLLFALYNIVLMIIFSVGGDLDFRLQAQMFIAVVSMAILLNLLSLLSSVRTEKKQSQSSAASLILLGLILAPAAVGGVSSLMESDVLSSSISFFSLKLPAPLMITLISLYFCCWSFAGLIRKFTHERKPLFTYSGALGFMAGYSILVCGLFWAYLADQNLTVLYLFWTFVIIPLLLIPFASGKSYDMYLEGFRFSKESSTPGSKIRQLFTKSNFFLWLSLFILWGIFSAGMCFKIGSSPLPFLPSILIVFSFVFFFSLLFELNTLYKPSYSKIEWFLGLVVLIHLVLPLILAGILKNDSLVLYSSFGYLAFLFNQNEVGEGAAFAAGVLALNMLLCVISAGLIWPKYVRILKEKYEMSASA
jgi:hypothetical protein